jgi:ankyrin repeat protein
MSSNESGERGKKSPKETQAAAPSAQRRVGDPLTDALAALPVPVPEPVRAMRLLSELAEAAAAGDLQKLERCLAEGADPNGRTPWNENTALMEAAGAGRLACVERLLEAGADPAAKARSSGRTALMRAAIAGKTSCARRLARAGALGERDTLGDDALGLALIHERWGCVQALLPHADWQGKNKAGKNALCLLADAAARSQASEANAIREQKEALAHALRAGAPAEPDNSGRTPLMAAASHGEAWVLRELIQNEAGGAVSARDRDGLTAFLLAVSSGMADCVELLAPLSDARAKDKSGRDAFALIDLCVKEPGHEAAAREAVRKAIAAQEEREIKEALAAGSASGQGESRAKKEASLVSARGAEPGERALSTRKPRAL